MVAPATATKKYELTPTELSWAGVARRATNARDAALAASVEIYNTSIDSMVKSIKSLKTSEQDDENNQDENNQDENKKEEIEEKREEEAPTKKEVQKDIGTREEATRIKKKRADEKKKAAARCRAMAIARLERKQCRQDREDDRDIGGSEVEMLSVDERSPATVDQSYKVKSGLTKTRSRKRKA